MQLLNIAHKLPNDICQRSYFPATRTEISLKLLLTSLMSSLLLLELNPNSWFAMPPRQTSWLMTRSPRRSPFYTNGDRTAISCKSMNKDFNIPWKSLRVHGINNNLAHSQFGYYLKLSVVSTFRLVFSPEDTIWKEFPSSNYQILH